MNIGQGLTDDDARWSALTDHVDRIVAAGGTVIEHLSNDFGERWVVMADPDGNEFCVR